MTFFDVRSGWISFWAKVHESKCLHSVAWLAFAIAQFETGHADALFHGDAQETSGDALQFALPAVAAGVTAFHRDQEGALQWLKSTVSSVGISYALKYAVDSERPDGGRLSFPSGHSAVSFSSAEFLRKRYGWELGLPAYGVASWVAYTRVNANRHYPRDVVAGAAIGIASSYFFTRSFAGWELSAQADLHGQAVTLHRMW